MKKYDPRKGIKFTKTHRLDDEAYCPLSEALEKLRAANARIIELEKLEVAQHKNMKAKLSSHLPNFPTIKERNLAMEKAMERYIGNISRTIFSQGFLGCYNWIKREVIRREGHAEYKAKNNA